MLHRRDVPEIATNANDIRRPFRGSMMVGRRDNPCPPPRLPLLPHETGLTDDELDLLCDIALNEMKLEKREAKVARDIRKRENFDTIAQADQVKRR